MFDDTKMQALADDLRKIAWTNAGLLARGQGGRIIDGMLADIISRLLVDMQENRHYAWALMETLKQQFSGE